MNRYIIETKDVKEAAALIRYLKSLDFVDLKPVKAQEATLLSASSKMKSLLLGLPDQPNKQSDVNKAVKSIRKKHGYQ